MKLTVLQQTPSRSEQALLFARNFFKHPRMLGSLIPSSRFLTKELLKQIDWKRARVIVEYGPGVGNITTEILRRLRPGGKMIVFETNAEFVEFLRESLRDPRLHVVHGSAERIGEVLQQLGFDHADYVISGIPFSTMPEEVRARILRNTRTALNPQGRFLVYQFSPAVLPYLKQSFREVRKDFEPLNILPAWLYFCTP
ncbi:MAG: methyltransferase domain-containing protein [Gemmatimonadota bacterium]|jgi:phospholipid N-methyltransferase|nr:methyltransferase domain-containing protein [Gemmatimonadota bacterium]MDQ3607126.1 methyltransferase domain-containing protein [Gemmatimonadota bacterium]